MERITNRVVEWQQDARLRAQQYASNRGIRLTEPLGQGYDGVVFSSDAHTAIKALAFERLYRNERNVYLRLMELQIGDVRGFAVPSLMWADDSLWVIEMEIVAAPFVLDFAGAYLDKAPDYPADVMATWEADKREQFGDEDWETVRLVMFEFQRMGIHLADVKPGNITFAD